MVVLSIAVDVLVVRCVYPIASVYSSVRCDCILILYFNVFEGAGLEAEFPHLLAVTPRNRPRNVGAFPDVPATSGCVPCYARVTIATLTPRGVY